MQDLMHFNWATHQSFSGKKMWVTGLHHPKPVAGFAHLAHPSSSNSAPALSETAIRVLRRKHAQRDAHSPDLHSAAHRSLPETSPGRVPADQLTPATPALRVTDPCDCHSFPTRPSADPVLLVPPAGNPEAVGILIRHPRRAHQRGKRHSASQGGSGHAVSEMAR